MDTNTFELITKYYTEVVTNHSEFETKQNKAALKRSRKSALLLAKALKEFCKETLIATKSPKQLEKTLKTA